MAIQLHITRTHKTAGNQEGYYQYDKEVKTFADMASAKAWLKQEYTNWNGKPQKRVPMYRDSDNKQIGYVYSFKTEPASYGDKHGFDAHWVSFHKLTTITI